MKIIACFTIFVFILSGCTTLRPIKLSQPAVQERISSGDLIHPGDKVRIFTINSKQYDFKVISVEDGYVKGKDVEIAVKDIAQVEKSEISKGKTALLAGAALLIAIIAIAANSMAHNHWMYFLYLVF